jgi:beta-carotene hydroxylase
LNPFPSSAAVGGLKLPSLDLLGRDLLVVPAWRRAASLVTPFLLAIAFFVCAGNRFWTASIGCTTLLTFVTYGSMSHDLVHRTLRLPAVLNEGLLCAIELIAFRCGHAYRITHLNHHKRFPAVDDLEGAAAHMTWWRALLDGITLQPRLWIFAFRCGRDRAWTVSEAIAVLVLVVAAIAAIHWTIAPVIYAALMVLGSWLFPFITSFIPHDPKGESDLTRTRLFRGRVLSIIALEHLYHLEHHLYPQVPHHNWPELGRRLDPHLSSVGLRPLRLFF